MKKEISPAVTIAVIAVIVLIVGFFAYQRFGQNPPTPRDHVDTFLHGPKPGGGTPTATAGQR